uniref:Phosphatidic acid phosphatase type 2/haloperoxidase domain-containing protein n=1 Tax=Anolis carolinensis TaxID=28377 RepID=A0A803TA55_ANOCA
MAGVTISCTVVIISAGEAYLVYTERLYSRSGFNNYLAALYKVVGTFLFGGAVSQSLTDLAKYMVGRLRPNFLAVCDPDWSKVNCSVYVQLEGLCRGGARNVTESRLSFYSGHSSFGMYCMMFLALYVQARLVGRWARLVRPTVQFFLVSFAVFVGYSRVSDYKHHYTDVLIGLIQGALVAILVVGVVVAQKIVIRIFQMSLIYVCCCCCCFAPRSATSRTSSSSAPCWLVLRRTPRPTSRFL